MRKLFWLIPGGLMALLWFLPLSWIAPFVVPSAFTTDQTQYRGTLWSGTISALRDVDTVNYKLKPLNAIIGKMPLSVDITANGISARGGASNSEVKEFGFKINVSSLPLPDLRLRGLAGEIYGTVENARWDKDRACVSASGAATSNILTQNRALFAWEGPVLSGPISCDEAGSVIFDLKGADAVQSITVKVAISAAGQYHSDMRVVTKDPEAELVLPLFGFEERGRVQNSVEFRLVEQGQWR